MSRLGHAGGGRRWCKQLSGLQIFLGTRCTHKNYFLLVKGTVQSFSLHCVVVADFGIRFGEQDPNAGKISL